jgi:DNA-binding response OmpR family regulator
MRVLVAEDDVVLQMVLQSLLTHWGYDVVAASDGEEAWRQLQQEDGPRLAILDWVMPGVDGIEVCRRIRASNLLHDSYILILTAKTGSEDFIAAMEAGANDYINKPFKPAELRASLHMGSQVLELHERLQSGYRPLVLAPVSGAAELHPAG